MESQGSPINPSLTGDQLSGLLAPLLAGVCEGRHDDQDVLVCASPC
jgi:hypothetical protein